jgi:hypothetical protein
MRAIVLIAVTVLASSATLQAQGRRPSGGLTLATGPLEQTRDFLITEFCASTRLGKGEELGIRHGSWELGLMRNAGRHAALGATLYLSTDDYFDPSSFVGFKPRFRLWLDRRWRADVGAGLLLFGLYPGRREFNFPGYVAHASAGYGDWFSIVLQFEDVEYSIEGFAGPYAVEKRHFYLGAATGSYPGLVLGSLFFIGVIVGT